MFRKFVSLLSTLFILAGLIVPLPVFAAATTGGWRVTSTVTYGNNETTITYTATRTQGYKHDLSHISIPTCNLKGSPLPKSGSKGVTWSGKDGSLKNDNDTKAYQDYTVIKFDPKDSKQSASGNTFTFSVTYNELWTGSGPAFSKASTDFFQSIVTVPCNKFTQVNSFEVTKTASPTAITGAGTVTYAYTVTNNGNSPLTITNVTDTLHAADLQDWVGETLQPGQFLTKTVDHPFDSLPAGAASEQVTNTVSVTAKTSGNQPVGPETASATITKHAPEVEPVRGAFAISKTANPTTVMGGEEIAYTYTITNLSDVAITITDATDDKIDTLFGLFYNKVIGPHANLTETVTVPTPLLPYGNDAYDLTNTWTVDARDAVGQIGEQEVEATVTVNPLEQLLIAFACVEGEAEKPFQWTITNPNPIAVEVVWSNTDPSIAISPASGEITVPANGERSFYTSAPTDPTQHVTVAIWLEGEEQDTAQSWSCAQPVPSFRVEKEASQPTLQGGGQVTYTYRIINDGELALRILSVEDVLDGDSLAEVVNLFPVGTVIPAGGQLEQSSSRSFPAIDADATAQTKVNRFTVIMETLNADWSDDESASATVTLLPNTAAPAIQVTKMADKSVITGDGVVTYSFEIKNTGNVTLRVDSIHDPMFSDPAEGAVLALSAFGAVPLYLAPGESASSTGNFAKLLKANLPLGGDLAVTNTVSVSATYERSGQEVTAQDSVTVTVKPVAANPRLTLTKVADKSRVEGSGNVTYTYVISNDGNVPLRLESATDVKIADFFPGAELGYFLLPGQSVNHSYTKSFNPAAGTDPYDETNTFAVTYYHPNEEEARTQTVTATVSIIPPSVTPPVNPPVTPPVTPPGGPIAGNPSFSVAKSVSRVNDPSTGESEITLTNGGTAYYFYTVTNTGDVPIVITSAVDDKLGSVSFSPLVVNPGATSTARLQKSFSALALGSEPQVETNIVTVTAGFNGTVVGPESDSATVINSPIPAGSVTVRVLDNSPRNDGAIQPVAGAEVTLSNGFRGTTNANGEIRFSNLVFGSYTATGGSADPVTGADYQEGTGEATIDAANPDEVINILLSWTPAFAGSSISSTSAAGNAQPAQRGSITVLVIDGSARNGGTFQPIPGASVTLAGRRGTTNAAGLITFTDLPFASYSAFAESADPQNPTGSETKSGNGQAEINKVGPNEQITIVLMWEPPFAGPSNTASVAAADGMGSIKGRICAPRAPGAEISATDAAGRVIKTFVAATGKLGAWIEYELTGLATGQWTLTLNAPGDAPASQTIGVTVGTVAVAPDFTLACTGQAATSFPVPVYYLSGGLLVLVGLLLRRYGGAIA